MLLIQQYNAARQAGSGDIEAASEELSELSGIYLDVDSRNKLKELARLRSRLISAKKYDEAIGLAVMASESLVPGDRSINQFFLPDTLRYIAEKMRSRELAKWALAGYERIPRSSLQVGKFVAAKKLLRNL